MRDDFFILDLSRSTEERPVFWMPNDMGYTDNPFEAGRYAAADVMCNWQYYNDEVESVAIPISAFGLMAIGFTCNIKKELCLQCLEKSKYMAWLAELKFESGKM